jgi:uncharacterized membrane protein (GlpM family)
MSAFAGMTVRLSLRNRMLPDPLFWYGLALKVTLTATIVVVASVAAERSGPFIAALIAALPTAAGATYIILALEHPPDFIAAGAVGSMAANAAVAIFALGYTALAQRHGIVLSIAAASLVWFATVAALRLVEWTAARYRTGAVARESFKRTGYDLPLRAAAVAVVVAAVTTASHWIGPFASGTFAVFPIVMGSFAVIMHPRAGGKAAAAVFAHAQPALVGLCFGFLGVHYLVEPIGVWWSLAAGLAITMTWSAALWLVRRARLRMA